MLDVIRNNPFRILGVYANASKREILANMAKIKAFAKVGKETPFFTDFNAVLPPVLRSEEVVAAADADISLPQEKLKYAQFWFLNETDVDKEAFNFIAEGKIDRALSLWSENDTVSAFQNSIVYYLIKEEYVEALYLAEELYSRNYQEFISTVTDSYISADKSTLFKNLVDALRNKISIFDLLDAITLTSERERIAKDAVADLRNSVLGFVSNSENSIQTIEGAKALGIKCSSYLGEIYSLCRYIEDGEMIAQRLSTIVGERMLSMLISHVNRKIDEENNREASERIYNKIYSSRINFEELYRSALNVIFMIRELRLEDVYAKGRLREQESVLQKNYWNITHRYIKKLDGDNNVLDLRDSRRFWASCITPSDLKEYCERYPFAFNIAEVPSICEDLIYRLCENAEDYKKYIADYPKGKYVKEALARLEKLLFEACNSAADCEEYLKMFDKGERADIIRGRLNIYREEIKRKEEERQRQETLRRHQYNKAQIFTTVRDLVKYYNEHKTECLVDIWSVRAQKLASGINDYRLVASTFEGTPVGESAQQTYLSLKTARRNKITKWVLWLGIPIGVVLTLLLIGLLNGNFYEVLAYMVYGLSILTGIGVFAGLIALMSGSDAPGCLGQVFFVMAIACAYPVWIGADSLMEYSKCCKERAVVLRHPTISKCKAFLDKYPKEYQNGIVLSALLDQFLESTTNENLARTTIFSNGYDGPLDNLDRFIEEFKGTSQEKIASTRYKAICDSLYNIAEQTATVDGWNQFKAKVPRSQHRDADQRIDEIEFSTESKAWETVSKKNTKTSYEKYLELYPTGEHVALANQKIFALKYGEEWSTESKAWQTARARNTVYDYEKYLEIYPNGAHKSAAERRIVEIRAAEAESSGTALPKMDKVSYGWGTTSEVMVTNSTGYSMTLKYYGPESKVLTIPAGATRTISLTNGKYSISASVADSSVRDYYGVENLDGGGYSIEYYISTSYGSYKIPKHY